MPICAYCGTDARLTKEHIWPRALIQKFASLYTFNPRTKKVFVGDAVVKDVCAICNNQHLSRLDSYLSELFDAYFDRVLAPGEAGVLRYDYQLLVRGLLKISYNSARASKDVRSQLLHKQFARFILRGGHANRLAVRLQVVTSARKINVDTGEEGVLNPVELRCATLGYDGPLSHRFMIRIIGFNSYWFLLVLSYKPEPPHKWREVLEALGKWKVPTGIPLSPSSKEVHVPVHLTTHMHPVLLGSLLDLEAP